jgi:hypothetical protein
MKQKIIAGLLLLVMLTSTSIASLSSVYAKDMNVPDNTVITYYTGANFEISLPFILTIPVNPSLTYHVNALDIRCLHVEAGSLASGDYIVVHFLTDSPTYPDVPWAVLTTSTEPSFLNFWKTILSGSPVYIPGSFDNVIPIPDALSVERHGNAIDVNLATDQVIRIIPSAAPTPPSLPKMFTLPAFTIHLDKMGGSIHEYTSMALTGYPGASNYVENRERIGFNSEGTFNCNSWTPNTRPVTNGFNVMHGIMTYTAP